MSFAAVFLLSRGFSNSEIGLTLTLGTGLTIVSQPVVATFADRTRKIALRHIVAGLMGLSLSAASLLLFLPPLFAPTAGLYVLLMCAFGTQGPLVTSLAMEHINTGTPVNFSLARGIGSFAFALVALLLGNLTKRYGGGFVLPVGMSISLIGILLVSNFPTADRPPESGQGTAREAPSGFWEFALRNRRFIALVGSVALLYFSHILINSYAIQIIRNVGGTSVDMGIASAIGGFLELPAMALFPVLLRRIKNAGALLKTSGVFLVLKTLVTLLAPDVRWIYAAQCLQFFAFATFIPASVYYVKQVIPQADKVKGQAGMTMAMGISGMVANFLGGLMLDTRGGVRFMLTVGLGVSMVGLALVLVLVERPKAVPD
jgi:PPP family 3-phenylpropionic acid transporter